MAAKAVTCIAEILQTLIDPGKIDKLREIGTDLHWAILIGPHLHKPTCDDKRTLEKLRAKRDQVTDIISDIQMLQGIDTSKMLEEFQNNYKKSWKYFGRSITAAGKKHVRQKIMNLFQSVSNVNAFMDELQGPRGLAMDARKLMERVRHAKTPDINFAEDFDARVRRRAWWRHLKSLNEIGEVSTGWLAKLLLDSLSKMLVNVENVKFLGELLTSRNPDMIPDSVMNEGFNIFDFDGSGSVSEEEVKFGMAAVLKHLVNCNKMEEASLRHLFHKADSNDDKELNQDEFADLILAVCRAMSGGCSAVSGGCQPAPLIPLAAQTPFSSTGVTSSSLTSLAGAKRSSHCLRTSCFGSPEEYAPHCAFTSDIYCDAPDDDFTPDRSAQASVVGCWFGAVALLRL